MTKAGSRIGAIFGGDEETKTVTFLGFGVYVEDAIPVEAVGFLAELCQTVNRKNPRLELDNGTVVYGCECWWGPEAKIKGELEAYKEAGYTVVDTNIDDIRQAYVAEAVADESE